MLMQQKRRGVSLFLIFVLLFTMLLPVQSFAAPTAPLTDISGSYAENEIQSLIEHGIISGYEDGTFQPAKAMSRAEFAKIIALALDLKEKPDQAAVFKDIAASSWYRGYVGAITEHAITNGTSTDTFSPDASVTREELVVFFIRGLGLEEAARKLPLDTKLADLAEVSSWAQPAVSLAFSIGFINGMEEGGTVKFNPKQYADRQALARLAYEFITNKARYAEKAAAMTASDSANPISEVKAISNTAVEVTFKQELAEANLSDFSLNGLKITKAELKSGSKSVVVLTTEAQTSGTVYTLSYKGKDSGKTITGIAPALMGGGGPGGGASSPNPTDLENINKGGTYASLTIKASGLVGPADGSLTTVTGTLTLDPGADGEITLQNVEAEEIVVASGSSNSIKLKNTIINTLKIAANNQTSPARIQSLNGSNVKSILVESKVIIESTAGNLGMIKIGHGAEGQEVELRGTLKGGISVDSSSTRIKIAPPPEGGTTSVTSLNLSSKASIDIAEGATLGNVNITSSQATIEMAGNGRVGNITVAKEAAGATLNLASIKINSLKLEANVKLQGDAAAIGAVPIIAAEGVVIEVAAGVAEELKSQATAAIAGIGSITKYDAELEIQILAAETLAKNAILLGAAKEDIPGYETTLQQAKEAITKYALIEARNTLHIQYYEEESQDNVKHDIVLPVFDSVRGVSITWNTSNTSVITSEGKVTAPAAGNPDAKVTLTATLTKDVVSEELSFILTVQAQQAEPEPQPEPVLEQLTIEPAKLSLNKGEAKQLKIRGIYSNKTTVDLTDKAAFTSSNQEIASVSAAGLVTALSSGIAQITVTYENKSTHLPVEISSPPVENELQLKATAVNGQVSLNWKSVGSSVTYQVYASKTSGSYGDPILTVQNATYATVSGIVYGQKNYFMVKAQINNVVYTSNEVEIYLSAPQIPTSKPTVTGSVYTNSFLLTGTSEPSNNNMYTYISLYKKNGTYLGGTSTKSSGEFILSSLKSYDPISLEAGEEVLVYAETNGKSRSEPVAFTVLPTEGQTSAPVLTAAVNEIATITGTAEPEARIYLYRKTPSVEPVTEKSGQFLLSILTSPEGKFSFNGHEGLFTIGEELTFIAVSLSKAASEPVSATVQAAPQTPTPTVTGTVYTNSWRISGSLELNNPEQYSYLYLRKQNGDYIASASVGKDGQFTTEGLLSSSIVTLTQGETVFLTAHSNGQKASKPVNFVVQTPTIKTSKVMLDISNEVLVSGWAEFGSRVAVTKSTYGTSHWTPASSTNGFFEFRFSEGGFLANEQVSITAAVIGQQDSDPVVVKLAAAPITAQPTVTGSVYTNTIALSGTMEPGAVNAHTVASLTKQNKYPLYSTYDYNTGKFDINWLHEPHSEAMKITAGEELLLTAQAYGKKKSEPIRITVQATSGQTSQPTDIVASQVLVTGKAEPGAYVKVSYRGQERTITTRASSVDGTFSYSTSDPMQQGEQVTVTATSVGKATSEVVEATVVSSKKTATPNVSGTVFTNSFSLSGTTDPEDTRITVYITTTSGSYIGTLPVWDGAFTGSDLNSLSLAAGQEVLVTAEAHGKIKSDPVRMTVKATEGQTAVPSYTELTESGYFTGKAEPGALIKLTNDTLKETRTAKASADGSYSIYLHSNFLRLGDQLSLEATTVGKATSDTVHITLIED